MQKYKNIKQIKAASWQLSNPSFFNPSISLKIRSLLKPAFKTNLYIYVIVSHISNYIVTVTTPKITAQYAVNFLFRHWISNFGPPQYATTNRGTECLKIETPKRCFLFIIIQSPRTSYGPWKNGIVEVQAEIIDSIWEYLYVKHLTTGLFEWNLLLMPTILNQCHIYKFHHMKFFHEQSRSSLNFQLNFPWDTLRGCSAQYSPGIPPESQNFFTDLIFLFDIVRFKPNFRWFLTIETANLQILSKVDQYEFKKNILGHTMQDIPTFDKTLPLNFFALIETLKLFTFSINWHPFAWPFQIY